MSENLDKTYIPDLQELGLTDKQALVYLALLGAGEVGSSKIIKATNLHGQYVYEALRVLEEQGLVLHVVKRGRKKFSAKNPKRLSTLANRQKQIADELSEKLQESFVLPEGEEYEMVQGQEAYALQQIELLKETPNDSELLIIGATGGGEFVEAMGNQFGRYESLRLKKKISIRLIDSESQRALYEQGLHKQFEYFKFRMLPGLFTGMVGTVVWPKAIVFNVLGDPVTSFLVSSSVVAESQRHFFETLWKLAK